MNTKRKKQFMLLMLLLLAQIIFAITACSADGKRAVTSLEHLSDPGRKIGASLNTPEEALLRKDFPDAEIVLYTDAFLAYQDVVNGRIDAMVYARRIMELSIQNGVNGVRLLDENYTTDTIAVGISPVMPIPDFENKLNTFIAELRADGTLDDMYDRWVLQGNETMPDIPQPENPSVHLRVATAETVEPYSYYVGKDLNGYDIELAYRFAAWLNAKLEFKVYSFDGIIAAAHSGDVDCIMSNLYYSKERSEALPYSDPLFNVDITVMVKDTGAPADAAADEIRSFSDLNGKTISMLMDAPFEELMRSKAQDLEITRFNNTPDMLMALKSGKTDAVMHNNMIAALAVNRNPELTLLPQSLKDGSLGFAFAKGDTARDAWQTAYSAISEDEKQALWEKWTSPDDSLKTLPEQDWPGLNGTVQAAACNAQEPMCYTGNDGTLMGFDIEMILRIAKELDVHVEFTSMDASEVLPAVLAGKTQVGAGSIIVTPEQKESFDFIEYYPASIVLIVRDVQSENRNRHAITSFADLRDKRIGVQTGTSEGIVIEERFPEAAVSYFNTTTDLTVALMKNKIDAFPLSLDALAPIMKEHEQITYLSEPLTVFDCAIAFSKSEDGKNLCSQFNTFLEGIKTDGTLQEMWDKWLDSLQQDPIHYDALPSTNGTLQLATEASYPPYEFVSNGRYAGLDIELATRFCEAYGYGLEIVDMSFDAVIAAVQTGKCNFAASGIEVTLERAQNVRFSDFYHKMKTVIAVLRPDDSAAAAASDTTDNSSFLDSFISSFNKTFIREKRWLLFVEGVQTTLLITVLSILFGTALGFLVFMLCRKGNMIANGVTRCALWLIQGMPMVVLLMILYYIIFGSVAINGIFVAVISFTLTFGSSVFGLLRLGVGTIDRGQYEAAYALGYSDRFTFFRIILPQAVPHILPSYKGEIVGLIKATSIVGYIAVQDLTKMGDIVRSRTYEAFFPLIAVTVIYFLLEGLLGILVSKIQIRMNPKHRKPETILKGVNVHD